MSAATTRCITVHYFAMLREQRGVSEETVDTAAATPRQLYAELQARTGLSLPPSAVTVAVNDRFTSWDAPLQDGDHVVFIQPVAGG